MMKWLPQSPNLLAVFYGLLYAVSSAGETVAIKSLNYNSVPLQIPTYTAFISNQMWIFMLPVYIYQYKERKSLKKQYWTQYILMGCLIFAITMMRHISINLMPGSVFSLLISTSILFTILLSKLILHKTFTIWHMGAVVFCLASACSIGFAALFTDQENSDRVNYKVGISTALIGAFLLGVLNVMQECIQPTWDSYDIRVVELTIVSSIIASVLVIMYATFGKEIVDWTPAISASIQATEGLALVVCISIALPILKLLARNAKYAAIKYSSAFFVEFAQSSGALLGSITNILVFNEPWGIGYIVAIILMAISFALYAQSKRAVQKMPPPPDYPKGEIRIMNPLETNLKVTTTTAKQQEDGRIVVSVTLWK